MGRGRLCTFPRLPRHSVMAALSPCSQACSSSCRVGTVGWSGGVSLTSQQRPSQSHGPLDDASCSKSFAGTHAPWALPAPHLVLMAPLAIPFPSEHCWPLLTMPPSHPCVPRSLLATTMFPGQLQTAHIPLGTTGVPLETTSHHPVSLWTSLTTHVPLGTADLPPQPPATLYPQGPTGHPTCPQPPLTSSLPWNSHSLPLLSLGTEHRHQCHARPLCHPARCRALT